LQGGEIVIILAQAVVLPSGQLIGWLCESGRRTLVERRRLSDQKALLDEFHRQRLRNSAWLTSDHLQE